jgi:VWFA-related protein
MTRILVHILFLVLLVGFPAAQEQIFRTQTNVVLVPALVKDGNGHAVYGLQAKDFVVEDDGVEQTLKLDETVEAEPVSLVIAIQSGRTASAEFKRMRTLAKMLDPVVSQKQTQVAIVVFDSQVNLIQEFTSDAGVISGDLTNLRSGDGGAAILDAVDYSVKMLDKVPNGRQRVLLLISETRDHGSHMATIEDVVTAVGRSNTVVYTLAFSPTVSGVLDNLRGNKNDDARPIGSIPNTLAVLAAQAMRKNTAKEIAAMTGGEYELFKSHRSFETLMNQFANHLHIRYLLSFVPRDPHGGLHEIRVRLKEPANVSILARSRYWAIETSQ